MPLWKISVVKEQRVNGYYLVKGMYVEFPTNYSSDPRYTDVDAVAKAFSTKYNMDETAVRHMIRGSNFQAEKI